MKTTKLSDLYLAMAPWAPGYNEDSAIDELRRATREFCIETGVAQQTYEGSIGSGDRTLAFDPGSQQLIVTDVISVNASYGPITVTSLEHIAMKCAAWRTAKGDPDLCTTEDADENEVVLNRAPTRDIDPVFVRIAVAPSITASEIPTAVVNKWMEPIIDLALHRILSIPEQTWTNPAEAMRRFTRYQAYESRAKIAASRNGAFQDARPRLPNFK